MPAVVPLPIVLAMSHSKKVVWATSPRSSAGVIVQLWVLLDASGILLRTAVLPEFLNPSSVQAEVERPAGVGFAARALRSVQDIGFTMAPVGS